MSTLESFNNFNKVDPFADTGDEENSKSAADIHIRIQQRNGRKTLTTVQGIPETFKYERILKVLKKDFATNGNIVKDEESGVILQLQGDQRVKIQKFLIEQLHIDTKIIKIHGF